MAAVAKEDMAAVDNGGMSSMPGGGLKSTGPAPSFKGTGSAPFGTGTPLGSCCWGSKLLIDVCSDLIRCQLTRPRLTSLLTWCVYLGLALPSHHSSQHLQSPAITIFNRATSCNGLNTYILLLSLCLLLRLGHPIRKNIRG